MLFSALTVVAVASVVLGCGDDHGHVYHKRKYPPTRPTHPLVWGDFNVIHTTDTHGWLLGHQKSAWPEPNYSGDLGDFVSFVAHMKEIAIQKDVDLLLVDSGDLHDGTGLSDGYPAGGVDAHESNKFVEQLPYDIMAIGNHELYVYANAFDMYTNFAPTLGGRYLSSNVNITVLNEEGESVNVPVGQRFNKFTTRKGRKVTSLGVLYDFTGNDVNTTVQTVANMVEEEWFTEAIAEEPDVFVLVGHMPVSYDNWPTVFNAVRAVHPTTPIMIFGGHSHIRDCLQHDGRSMALESGRYMETIGWMSANLSAEDNSGNIPFSRRYMDQNRVAYEYHTGRSNSTFDTTLGQGITQGLRDLARQFDLSFLFGTSPQDYTMNQDRYPSNNSVLSLFIAEATPVALAINNTRASIPNIIICNSGVLRFDVFSGPFTKNDQLTATPFTDRFSYIPNITLSVASQVLPHLNSRNLPEKRDDQKMWARGYVDGRYHAWLEDMAKWENVESRSSSKASTPGYVTHDKCPGVGDDVLHTALPYHRVPSYIASNTPDVADNVPIDLVFVQFIESNVLTILNGLNTGTTYTSADVQSYSPTLSNAILGMYAQEAWN